MGFVGGLSALKNGTIRTRHGLRSARVPSELWDLGIRQVMGSELRLGYEVLIWEYEIFKMRSELDIELCITSPVVDNERVLLLLMVGVSFKLFAHTVITVVAVTCCFHVRWSVVKHGWTFAQWRRHLPQAVDF